MKISIRASKLVSDKPAFSGKEKTESGGTVYRYDDGHIEKRWKLKKKQLKLLNKNIEKLRKSYEKDLNSDDLRTRALAAIVGIMDDTAMRVGNEDSVKEADTYGATTLKVKHLNLNGGKATFKFTGKDNVKQDVFTKNKKIISVLKELVKGKKGNDFIFEIDDAKIWDRAVNRYLAPFNISAKDIRGFKANKLMEEILKKKDFKEALDEVAKLVGHKASTLKNQYLDPDLVHKYDKKAALSMFLSKRAFLSEKEKQFIDTLKSNLYAPQEQNYSNFNNVKTNELIDSVWSQLEPHLSPLGARITSAVRSVADQERIIKGYWSSSGASQKYPNVKNTTEMAQILRSLGYSINDPDKTPHSSGRSFDVSGGDLGSIWSKIKEISSGGLISAKLNAIVEPKNNAVHIDIIRASHEYSFISKFSEKENIKSIYEDLVNSDATPEVVEEYRNAFGLEQDADDEKSYEETKEDPKWQEVLIDHDGQKWTRKEIRDHYVKNADKILKEIDNHPVMIYIGTGKGEKILKRHHNDKPIVIKNKEDLEYWADRRMTGIHRVFGKKTKLGFVDLDVHGDFSDAKVQEYAKEAADEIKTKYNTNPIIYDSGGSGYHIEFELKQEKDTDALRDELHDLCEKLNEKYEGFTTGIVKGNGVRTDTTTLKNNGNIRVPYAIHETKGGVKEPLKASKKASLSIRVGENPEVNIPKEQTQNDMGFGKDDEMGDFFEKMPMFRNKEIGNSSELSEAEAKSLSTSEPDKFFYKGLHKQYPKLEIEALKNIIKDNAKFYFVFKYNEREEQEYKDLMKPAAEALAQQDARAFFYYYLNEKFPELGRGAVIRLIDNNPGSFFDLGLDQFYPDYIESANNARNIIDPQKVQVEITEKEAGVSLSKRAEENIQTTIEENPAAFFVGKYYKQPEFKHYTRQAAINLLSFKPHLYFTLGLFDEPELSDLLDGAMFALANKNPKFFLDTIMPLERFKDFHHLKEIAEHALNKKASISKRAGEMIELSGIPSSIIEDLKQLPGKVDTLNYYTMENGKPVKTPIIDTIRGNLPISDEPKAYIHWVVNSYKLEPYQAPDKQYKVAVNLIVIDEHKQLNEQIFREYGPKLIPLVNKLKGVLKDLQNNSDKVLKEKYPEYFNVNNVIPLFSKASVQEFPKECKVCGKKYNNYEEFFNQPFRDKVVPEITTDDVGLMCGEEFEQPEIDHVYRDCNCGSTLVVAIPCLHKKYISKEAKKHYKAGIFAIVPKELAKQFPSLGKHDSSKPHITVLFIGKVPKKQEELLKKTIKEVLKDQKPFKVKLDDRVSYFPATKQSDNCKVAKIKIISDDLHELNKKLKKAVKDAGIEMEDNFPTYKPHITLEYMEEGKEKYDGDVPHGSFTIEKVELWNDGSKKKFNFGRKSISKLAGNIEVPVKMVNEIYQWAIPLLKTLAVSDFRLQSEKYKKNINFLLEMIKSGGKGSITDFAKNLNIPINKNLNIDKFIAFFHGIHSDKQNSQDGFFDKIANGTILEQANTDSEGSYNITINNENTDFKIYENNDKIISGVPYKCWPSLQEIRLTYGEPEMKYNDCDADLMYDLFKFTYNKENNTLEVDIIDESYLGKDRQRLIKHIEDIIKKIESGHKQNQYEEWEFENFIFERIRLKKSKIQWDETNGLGWLIRNNLLNYQKHLYEVDILVNRLSNYLHSVKTNMSLPTQVEPYKDAEGQIQSNSIKSFKVDPSGTKQYLNFKKEIDELLKDTFKEVDVNVSVGDKDEGWYDSPINTGKPIIHIQKLPNEQASETGFIRTLSHELVHLMQDLMTYAIKLRNDNLKNKNWHAGIPGKYDKSKYHMYSGLPGEDREFDKQHALSDVEFYSRLEDSLGRMQRMMRDPGIDFFDQKMIADQKIKNIYQLDLNNRIELMKNRFKRYIENYDDTLKHFKKYDPDKHSKFIKELHRGFEQILKDQKPAINKKIAKDPLFKYKNMRDFNETKEPEGSIEKGKNKHRFVIQKHDADKAGLHFDLRLENDNGTMTSFAIPKHKLPTDGERLFAQQTEDHPIAYNKFKGEISEGYGKGDVKIHDSGTYELVEWKRDTIKFKLKGSKEKGAYTLHKTDGKKWIIMRMKEE